MSEIRISFSSGCPTRRHALGTLAAAGVAGLLDPRSAVELAIARQRCDGAVWGELLGTLPLSRPDGVEQPFGVKLGGAGLDARQITDLSRLQPEALVTPNALAAIRTEAPAGAASPASRDWSITVTGQAGDARGMTAGDLARRARRMGAHLLECSGNNNPANFGLMSVSEYEGVPLADVVARLQPSSVAWGVLVAGMDPQQPSASSTAGAGWIVPLASLRPLGAFLATRMNGEPLPADHGAPVRLVVPGWYACSWIKWVNEIRLVARNEPATTQMKEFAGRTHQTRAHELARDYAPPEIEAAAMPIRVERRRSSSGLEYRIVGIVWGGRKPVDSLAIRFGADGAWTRFTICPAPKTHRIWSLWDYRWKPRVPGTYDIALKMPDASVPPRRLDSGFYVRSVRVDEV